MKQVLLFGAGKSATTLIDYLLAQSQKLNWKLVVADANLALAKSKINDSPFGEAVSFDIMDAAKRSGYINQSDLVISMLPPSLHFEVAKDCLLHSKHLLTASYVDDAMRGIRKEIEAKGLLMLCEMGLDPGIDHMSAMKIIDHIHEQGGQINSFQSHCGGLIAPEIDDNPWHYKISWNPRNIILAGKAGAHFLKEGKELRMDYEEVFRPGRNVDVPGLGQLSWYPNRDSLSYAPLYGLKGYDTFIRTTLRHPEFMLGWQTIVELKLTDETPAYQSDGQSCGQVFQQHIDRFGLKELIGEIERNRPVVLQQLIYLGLFDDSLEVNKGFCSAADLLQLVVEKKLALQAMDRDMIVMLHEFGYSVDGRNKTIKSTLVVKGENSLHTAMAKTVGLPLGIAARLLLEDKIKCRGLQIPTSREIYLPVLEELEEYGIRFVEE